MSVIQPVDIRGNTVKDGTGDSRYVKIDSEGRVIVTTDSDSPIDASPSPSTSVGDGTATVTTAGTRVQLSTVSCTRVHIQAHEENTGTIVVGGSTVVAALSGRRGRALFSTQSEVFNVSNLNLLYIDSTANGDKVHYYYEV